MEYSSEFPSPLPNSHQVLIKVAAAGINPVDIKMRKGPISDIIYPKPKIIGNDISGVIAYIPNEASTFQIGDQVFGMLPFLGSQFGAYAEYCCIDEALLVKAPSNVSLLTLCTIPLVACTIIQAFRPIIKAYHGNLKNKKCFIQGGSGGLGHIAVQYCANVLGMFVSTTCSPRNFDLLHSLGASEVIDYHTEKLEDRLENYDVFFDSVGYKYENIIFNPNCKIMKKTGELPSYYIHIASSAYKQDDIANNNNILSRDPLGLAIPEARIDRLMYGFMKKFTNIHSHIKYNFVLVYPESEALTIMSNAIEKGLIKVHIHKVLPLEMAYQAHDILENEHIVGKLALIVDPDLINNENE